MTSGIAFGSRRISGATMLLALVGLALAVALLTPEIGTGGGWSSRSTEANGARVTYELAERMGWRTERRTAPMDSVSTQLTAQVLIAPRGTLGSAEVHRLLENVRRGGGLVFTITSGGEIADSLGLAVRSDARYLEAASSRECKRDGFRPLREIPPSVYEIVWRRPPPSAVATFAHAQESSETRSDNAAIGFRLGAGHVAAISTDELFANATIRVCRFGADVAIAHTLEYMQRATPGMPLVFDEYHHGEGVHGGTVDAVVSFLANTAPGRFLAEALIAGLLLVLATAPRPIKPTDPERIARRSPLEHADALGHAYSDVSATRTATARLVSGLRRRVGRVVHTRRDVNDSVFLDAVTARDATLVESVAVVRSALDQTVTPRELIGVGRAIDAIEQSLLSPPPIKT